MWLGLNEFFSESEQDMQVCLWQNFVENRILFIHESNYLNGVSKLKMTKSFLMRFFLQDFYLTQLYPLYLSSYYLRSVCCMIYYFHSNVVYFLLFKPPRLHTWESIYHILAEVLNTGLLVVFAIDWHTVNLRVQC